MSESLSFTKERDEMVSTQLEGRGIKDQGVRDAFRKVPREVFVPEESKKYSYSDHPVPIGLGQTISQPYMVAAMAELLKLEKTSKVLEIGTGSGYQTAILAELSNEVYTVERIGSLSHDACSRLISMGYKNIKHFIGDGSCGWGEHSPYNGIIVACSAPSVPEPLKDQLEDGGRLVMPIGSELSQVLTLIERRGDSFNVSGLFSCVFVPLIGKHGWRE
ncbi:MAG: protein-L-isoaspartate(D-aspartate) O-methyltransferase [Candidatus Omnitrophota bacterium]